MTTLAEIFAKSRPCDESRTLWAGLEDVDVSRWDALGACLLALNDGHGPRVGAVGWLEPYLGSPLSGANLSGADLYGANLSGADLSRVNLSGADLSRVNLSGADLSRVNLSGANLYGANLSRVDLYGANLSGADLSGADLSGADLSGAWADKALAGWSLVAGRLVREVAK